MAEQPGQDKTEEATPKRREESKKKGQVAKSKELPMAMGVLVAAVFFWVSGDTMLHSSSEILRGSFSNLIRHDLSTSEFYAVFIGSAEAGMAVMVPFMLVMMIAGVATNVVQTGVMFSVSPIQPKFSKISPVQGLKRLFSAQTVMELIKSIIKIGSVGLTVYLVLASEIGNLPQLAGTGIEALFPYFGGVALRIAFLCAFVLVVLALIDFIFQRAQHSKQLRMTKDEVRREMKDSEGDPMLRARIRNLQRETAKKRMMSDVPGADVVVTNPTHLAVALKYDGNTMAAPRVVAKGAGHIATKIRELAAENGVPLMEDKPLARALYKSVEVGQEVPMDLYQAVAEILAFVYRMNNTRKSAMA